MEGYDGCPCPTWVLWYLLMAGSKAASMELPVEASPALAGVELAFPMVEGQARGMEGNEGRVRDGMTRGTCESDRGLSACVFAWLA